MLQATEFLLFAGLMYVTLFIYVLMSLSYKYKEEGMSVADDEFDTKSRDVNNGKANIMTATDVDDKPVMNGTTSDKKADGDGKYEEVELKAAATENEQNGGAVNPAFDASPETRLSKV